MAKRAALTNYCMCAMYVCTRESTPTTTTCKYNALEALLKQVYKFPICIYVMKNGSMQVHREAINQEWPLDKTLTLFFS